MGNSHRYDRLEDPLTVDAAPQYDSVDSFDVDATQIDAEAGTQLNTEEGSAAELNPRWFRGRPKPVPQGLTRRQTVTNVQNTVQNTNLIVFGFRLVNGYSAGARIWIKLLNSKMKSFMSVSLCCILLVSSATAVFTAAFLSCQ